MQSSINPSTTIRPLGEEHLRMFRRVAHYEGASPLKIILPKIAKGWPNGLPLPISRSKFALDGTGYTVLRYEEGKGPNLKQTIDTADHLMLQTLTFKEVKVIEESEESNEAFRNALKPGERGYIRDPTSESWSLAAFLYNVSGRGLAVYDFDRPDYDASVVILKEK